MNPKKPRKRRKILRWIGLVIALALFLVLFIDVLQDAFVPRVETLRDRSAQPAPDSEEQMMSDWKEMRERARRQPLEGQ